MFAVHAADDARHEVVNDHGVVVMTAATAEEATHQAVLLNAQVKAILNEAWHRSTTSSIDADLSFILTTSYKGRAWCLNQASGEMLTVYSEAAHHLHVLSIIMQEACERWAHIIAKGD